MTCEGEPAMTTGILGLGKSMPSNMSGRSDIFMSGEHHPDGALACITNKW